MINFVSAYLELKNTLEQAKAEMDAAAKEAQAEARKKSKTTGTKIETGRTNVNERPERLPPPADTPRSPGLFGSAPAATEATSETESTVATVYAMSDEDRAILDEIRAEKETEGDFTSNEMDNEAD